MTARAAGGILGAAGMIAALTLASRLVGFVRWLVHSWMLEGGSATAGAYATANQIPNILFEVAAGGALASVVIPLLAAPLARSLRREVDRTVSALLTWALLALVPLGVAVAFGAGLVAELLPDSVSLSAAEAAEADALVAYLLRIFALQIPLYGVGIVLSGVLQAHKRFFWPALAPLLSSLVVIASYVVFGALAAGNRGDPGALSAAARAWLGWGTTAGVMAMSLPLLIPVRRLGVRLRPAIHFPVGEARHALRLASAGLGALLAQQLAVLAVVVLAPLGGDPGTLSIFQYAQAVYVLPYAILAVPLATAVFPHLSELAASRSDGEFARLVNSSTRVILVVGFVGMAVLVADAPTAAPVFRVTEAMGDAITWLAPGIVGFALVFHSSRVLYAVDRGRAAVAATAAGWLVVVAASVALVAVLAPAGGDSPATLRALALGNSAGMLVAGAGLLAATHRLTGTGAAALLRTLAVALGGAMAGGLIGRLAVDAVLAFTGPGIVGSIAAAVPGAVLGAGLTVLAVHLFDRATLAPVLARFGGNP
ncbi:MAG: murein biosynthesis integral membrane protein MurJ [Actinomycetota bacterium]